MVDVDTEGAPDEMIGSAIAGRYRVVKLLGEGGMGKVYLAEQKMGNAVRKVAIKTLRHEFSMDQQIVARFMRECETVIELHHPNTVQFYDFGELPNKTLFIVMEFIEGEDLAHILQRGAIDVSRVDRILIQVCGSLHEAHQRGIVHRDLKPENILLTQRGGQTDFVKVLDFGIAKRGEAEEGPKAKLTKQGMILGTPPYMSPEQFSGQVLDQRSDIYSLGIMTFEMITNRFPFEANTPWEWATKHLMEEPAPIDRFAEGAALPESKRRAIMRALSKNREERQQSVLEFMHELTGLGDPQAAWTMATSGVSQAPQQQISTSPHYSPHPIATPSPMQVQSASIGGYHQSYQPNLPSYGETPVTYGNPSSYTAPSPFGVTEHPSAASGSSISKFVIISFIVIALGGAAAVALALFIIGSPDTAPKPQQAPTQNQPPTIATNQPDANVPIAPPDASLNTGQRSTDLTVNPNNQNTDMNRSSMTESQQDRNTTPAPTPQDAQLAAMSQTIGRQLSGRDLDGAINTFLQAQSIAPTRNHPTLTRARGQISSYGNNLIGSLLLGGANGCANAKAIYAKLRRIGAERRSAHHFGDWCSL